MATDKESNTSKEESSEVSKNESTTPEEKKSPIKLITRLDY